MKQKSKSKSTGKKTEQNYNQGGHSNENAWSRFRQSSVSDMWDDADEHFPALGASAAAGPKVNVWEERKSKQEAIKALQPQSEYDEEIMLQHALTLSLLEAEEEQKKRKLEEEYQKQLETLGNFETIDDFTEDKTVKFQNFPVKKHQSETHSENFGSKSSQNTKAYNCESFEFQHDLPVKEQEFDNSSASNNTKKESTYNSGGARPKISRAIEAFGGWGLKTNKKRNNSGKISEFVNDVVNEKSSYKNKVKYTKESFNSDDESWHSADSYNMIKSTKIEKSDNKERILYNEKGVFLDEDGGQDDKLDDSKNGTVSMPSVSPSTVLDTWLRSEDKDDWNDEILNVKETITLNDRESADFISSPPKQKIEEDKSKILSASAEFHIPAVTGDCEPKSAKDSQILIQETSEPIKNIWSNKINYEDHQLSENNNSCKYGACDLSENSFTPFHEPTEVPTLTSCKIWPDKSSDDSSYMKTVNDNLASQVESIKLSSDVNNDMSLSYDSDVPPIPPPQPPPSLSTENEFIAPENVISNGDHEGKSSLIPEHHAIPEPQVPQFPAFANNPIFNPMFPSFNPMMGFNMDPLVMRQMLILSNPFLANRLLALEQYYRSMGVPVDLFSMPNPMLNMGGTLNQPLLQNPAASTVTSNIEQLQSEIQQLQTQIDASASSLSENAGETVFSPNEQKSHESSAILDFKRSSVSEENNDNPWFNDYLSNDNASIIPPPKPPSNEVNGSNFISDSQKSNSDQMAYSYDKFSHFHASDNLVVPSSNIGRDKSIRKPAASIAKKEVVGWDNPKDDFANAQNHKSHIWDDGWGDPIPPPKSLRNSSHEEDKKKTVFRQPARQPQIGRYQKNFTYS